MATNNGAWYDYADNVPEATFFRAEHKGSSTFTVKAGQVLRKYSFMESLQAGGADKGKVVAHTGLAESAIVKFAAMAAAETLVIAGLTWTAGASGTTVAQLQAAWGGIAAGTGFAALSAITEGGTFTAGTMTGWDTLIDPNSTTSVIFTSISALTNVADLAATGTATGTVISKVDGSTVFNKIAGVLLYDVDATAADVEVALYTGASFWADALVWANDPTVDVITIEDGTTVACTAYNTGVYGSDKASSDRLKQQFVEGSEFVTLGFSQLGELANG